MTRAVGEDEVAAASIGIDVRRVKMLSFGLGGMLAGFYGVLSAHYIGLVAPKDMSFGSLIFIFFYIGIGGMHTYAGAVVGAVAITFLPEFLRFSVYDRYLFFGLALALMMLMRPFGLMVRRPIGAPGIRRQLAGLLEARFRRARPPHGSEVSGQ